LTFTAGFAIVSAMRRPSLKVRPYRHKETHPWVLDLRAFGGKRQFYRTRAEADAERLRQLTTLERHGRAAVGLPQRELSDFITAKRRLADYDKTINDAVDYYLDHLERMRRCKTTVADLAAELLEAKRKDGRSKVYLADLRNRLKIFTRDFGTQSVAAVTSRDVSEWLRNVNGSPKTRANFRQNISVLFGYAADEGMIDSNPVLRVKKPKLVDRPPEIFSVDDLNALLNAAAKVAPDVLPIIAIGAFAGLRESEIKRLHWSEVNLPRSFIEVKAEKAKTAKRRIVRIQPNLTQWLAPYAAINGPVVPVNSRKKLDGVRKAAGLEQWSKNGLRHSFASYRLAATNDAATVAAELGHSTSQVLYATYRELVLPEEAERFWEIVPQRGEAKNVVAFAAPQD
jgi:integrase